MIRERKQVSIYPFHEQSGCPFHEVNLAFVLKLLSEELKGWLSDICRVQCSPTIFLFLLVWAGGLGRVMS